MVQMWSSSIEWCICMSYNAYSHLAQHVRIFIVEHSLLGLILFPIEIVSYNMDKHQYISLSMIVILSSDINDSPNDDTSYNGLHRFIHVRTREWLSIDNSDTTNVYSADRSGVCMRIQDIDTIFIELWYEWSTIFFLLCMRWHTWQSLSLS
jgi:hypothetical protein